MEGGDATRQHPSQELGTPSKSAISSGCETHPANRSLGRKQSDEGGDEFVEGRCNLLT